VGTIKKTVSEKGLGKKKKNTKNRLYYNGGEGGYAQNRCPKSPAGKDSLIKGPALFRELKMLRGGEAQLRDTLKGKNSFRVFSPDGSRIRGRKTNRGKWVV